MKVLIITYYWPPSGGSGVQRWLKFVKYLRDFDIEPVVFTVENPHYVITDNTLQDEIPKNIEVIKHKIWEPNNLLGNKKQTGAGFLNPNPSIIEKLFQYIRANYFIPDARKYWVKPSVKYLKNLLDNSDIDIIITTGPPHSLHLIGLELKKKLSLKWIADFRDPWTEIDYFHQLPLTKTSLKKHKELEHEVLKNADAVLVVGNTMKDNFKSLAKNIHVITNGFDSGNNVDKSILDKKFSITHVGMMNADRNPKILWKVLNDIIKTNSEFKADLQVRLVGNVDVNVLNDIKNNGLTEFVNLVDYMPHKEVLQFQRSTQVLLLAVNNVPNAKAIITGKIYEYLKAERPILAIGPKDGDLAEIIKESNSGEIVDFDDRDKLKSTILDFYENYTKGILKVDTINIEKYHRKNLTKHLSQIIKNL